MGTATALFLARKGSAWWWSKGPGVGGAVGAEQSAAQLAGSATQGRDGAELPIMVEANRLWRQLAQEVDTDIGLAEGGVTYIA